MQRIVRSLALYNFLFIGAILLSSAAAGCSSLNVRRVLKDVDSGLDVADKIVEVTKEQVEDFCSINPSSKLCAPTVQAELAPKLEAGPVAAGEIEAIINQESAVAE
jgi:hypothetical protein